MITQEEALSIILSAAKAKLSIEKTPVLNALNRILAEDIIADIDMPPFDKSAMDGYACKLEDISKPLNIIETIAAGDKPLKKIISGTCSKIMTGAPIPDGANTVIMIEHTRLNEQNQVVFTNETTASNICYKGEDFKTTTLLLSKGTRINSSHIPIFATAGKMELDVYKSPKIGVISTGNELVEPSEIPSVGKIRNSNAYQIMAQAIHMGANTEYFGIAEDTLKSTIDKINEASQKCDIIILSGGVSAGDFDFVPKAISNCGFDILFKSIAVQPGRPTLFGIKEEKYIFGLPGNPVSSFVQFELLVKPLFFALLSHPYQAMEIKVPYGKNYQRKKSDRKAWLPIFINQNGMALPVDYNGSAHINSYINANAIMEVEIGRNSITQGEMVHARLI